MGLYTIKFGNLQVGDEVRLPDVSAPQDGPNVKKGFLHDRAFILNPSPSGHYDLTFVIERTEQTMQQLLIWWHTMVEALQSLGPQNVRLLLDGATKITYPGYYCKELRMPRPQGSPQSRYTWNAELNIIGSNRWEW